MCSDDSVANLSNDEFVEDVHDLGLPVTTNASEIKAFLNKRINAQRIVFVTYHSGPVFAEAARLARATIDLAIFDEAHKTVGAQVKSFATLLFDKNIRIRQRMFVTATERVVRGSHDDVVSMDKQELYGDCIYQIGRAHV